MHDNGRTQMWTYECDGNVKHQSPLGYYRSLAWLALKRNLTGIGFWSYCTSQYDPWSLPEGGHDYLLVYGGDGAVSSKRWEACRDGLEDMRAVWLLQDAIELARQAGKSGEVVDAAEACVKEAVAKLAGYNLESTIWFNEDDAQSVASTSSQRTSLDEQYMRFREFRKQIAELTLQLK